MKFKLSGEQRASLSEQVKAYYLDQFDEEIGELKAGFLIDYFIEQLGPEVYSQAITDAAAYIQEKNIDMENVLFFENKEQD